MTPEIDLLLDYRWWAGAIVQRHGFDIVAHEEGREHQKVDPDAHPEKRPGADFELTAWAKDFVREQVVSQLRIRLLDRNEKHGPLLEVPHDEHLARELAARAQSYFGASHEETRAKFHARRAEHKTIHDQAHLMEHRRVAGGPLEKISPETVAFVKEQCVQSMLQIDDYIAPQKGLIDRHVATVTMEVAEERRLAQQAVDELAVLTGADFEQLVAHYQAKVLEEIRRDPAAALAIACPGSAASTET